MWGPGGSGHPHFLVKGHEDCNGKLLAGTIQEVCYRYFAILMAEADPGLLGEGGKCLDPPLLI